MIKSNDNSSVKVSVLINNYNYRAFLEEAINSVLLQTYQNIELIVVDDGSTDGSQELIEQLAANEPKLLPIFKENGGQLSAFNTGIENATGDILFFLDSDDRYHRDYIEKAVNVYAENAKCDFLFTALREFDQQDKEILQDYPKRLNDLGYTGLITMLTHTWIGERTSGISLRRNLAHLISPLPYEEDWVIRADDCLVWMSSIAGARKYYLREVLIDYRIHENNAFAGKPRNIEKQHFREIAVARFFVFGAEKFSQYKIGMNGRAAKWLLYEAATGYKSMRLLSLYGEEILRNRGDSLLRRLKNGISLRYFKSRKRLDTLKNRLG